MSGGRCETRGLVCQVSVINSQVKAGGNYRVFSEASKQLSWEGDTLRLEGVSDYRKFSR